MVGSGSPGEKWLAMSLGSPLGHSVGGVIGADANVRDATAARVAGAACGAGMAGVATVGAVSVAAEAGIGIAASGVAGSDRDIQMPTPTAVIAAVAATSSQRAGRARGDVGTTRMPSASAPAFAAVATTPARMAVPAWSAYGLTGL
jgi:hypothetical protein